MVGRRVPKEQTMDDARVYLTSVKKAFRNEPAKYKELLKVLKDYMAHRVNGANTIAKVEQVLKGHRKLLLGFRIFLPKTSRTIPPEANKGFDQFQIVVGGQASMKEPRKDNKDIARVYLASVKDAFHDEPAKYDEFIKVMVDIRDQRIDRNSCLLGMEELMKDHRDLLLDFCLFLPPGAQITIPPESEKKTVPPCNDNKRKRFESEQKTVPPCNDNKRKRYESDEPYVPNQPETSFQSLEPLNVLTRQMRRQRDLVSKTH